MGFAALAELMAQANEVATIVGDQYTAHRRGTTQLIVIGKSTWW
jgi:hypothetical protein